MKNQIQKSPKESKSNEAAQKVIDNKIKSLPIKSKPQGPSK